MNESENSPTLPATRRERAVIAAAGLTLIWATWALGSRVPSLLWGNAVLAVLTFALLFLPLGWTERRLGSAGDNLRRLIRLPLFWLGLLLMIYMTIQGLNARIYIWPAGKGFMYRGLDHVEWLPTGLMTPFQFLNPYRMVLMLGSAWLVGCAIWVGVQRRRSLRILLWVFAINGFVWALILIAQLITKTPVMLWFYETGQHSFYGTLVNPNQASAMLNMALIAQLGLFLHNIERESGQFLRGGPHLMLIPMAAVMVVAVLQTLSRGGILACAAILIIFLISGAWQVVRMIRGGASPLLGIVVLLLMMVGAGAALKKGIDLPALTREWRTLQHVTKNPESDLRYYINQASWDMVKERPWFGWGAGNYGYFIPKFQKKYPELDLNRGKKKVDIGFAHNDYLNYLAELGIVGCTFIAAAGAWLAWRVLARRRQLDTGIFFALGGIAIILGHDVLEFFFYQPLLVLQFALLVIVLVRVPELRARLRRRAMQIQVTGNK